MSTNLTDDKRAELDALVTKAAAEAEHNAIAQSSKNTYQSDARILLHYCKQFNRPLESLNEDDLCKVCTLFSTFRSSYTIASFLSACEWQSRFTVGRPLPRGDRLTRVCQGLLRMDRVKDQPKPKQPLQGSHILRMLQCLNIEDSCYPCFRAMLIFSYNVAGRIQLSTSCKMSLQNFSPLNGSGHAYGRRNMEINVADDKNNWTRRVISVMATDDELDIGCALDMYVASLPPHLRATHLPLFLRPSADGVMLATAKWFTGRLKAVAQHLGLNPKDYASHSVRRGFIVDATDANVPEAFLKAFVGWAPNSTMHIAYARTMGRTNLAVGAALKRRRLSPAGASTPAPTSV